MVVVTAALRLMVPALTASAARPVFRVSGLVTVTVANGATPVPTVRPALRFVGEVTVMPSVSPAFPWWMVSELVGLVKSVSSKVALMLCSRIGFSPLPLSSSSAWLGPAGRLNVTSATPMGVSTGVRLV